MRILLISCLFRRRPTNLRASSVFLPFRHFTSTGLEKMTSTWNHYPEDGITRVLFCGPHFPASHNYTAEYLQNYPYIKVDVVPLDDVPNAIGSYHICVVKNMRLDSHVISHAKEMKLIMQYGVGLEGVDIDAATLHGIKVARIPGNLTGNSIACAEHAIYLILGLLRKQKEMERAINQMVLGEPVGETLFGKTVLILGYGNIGADLATRLRPFGVKILATKRSWSSDSFGSSNNIYGVDTGSFDVSVDKKGVLANIYEFAGEADVVVACMSLNNETAGIVDRRFLSSMKKGAILVNVARGGLLNYESVSSFLQSGYLGGLGIDVAWTEPFDPNDPILKLPNVLITPHIAGVTEYSYRMMAKVVGDCALQLHAGATMTGIEFVN